MTTIVKGAQAIQAWRASILHFVDEPDKRQDAAWEYFEDGILVVENGHVVEVNEASAVSAKLAPEINVAHYPHHLIIPGFIDTHTHYPQTEMIAAYGEQLLSWLNTYTFPTELKFSDEKYASEIADIFLNELLRNGTTTALVFGTVHPQSVDAFFSAAQARGLRMIAGKVLMDRHAPEALCDTPETAYAQSRELIERWHGVDRLQYAITPRFAPTCSAGQLKLAGDLLKEFDDVYMHTHLAENKDEVAWVGDLFPEALNYLDVYKRAGLLGKRSVFAHGVHLSDDECQQLAAHDSAIAHCPTSNLFLGSGLIDLQRLQKAGVKVGLGTDVGAGTTFSLFRAMDEAYKIQQLRGASLDPLQALFLATLGGARSLDLEDKIGNFLPGKEADFLILDLQATPLIKFRLPFCRSLRDRLLVLTTLGDDRLIEKAYSLGKCVHQRDDAF